MLGAVAELAAVQAMERRLGELAEPYHAGGVRWLSRAAGGLTGTGALLIAGAAVRDRRAAVAGGALVLAGAVCERWSVFRAGFRSVSDPAFTIGPQRAASVRDAGAGRAGGPDPGARAAPARRLRRESRDADRAPSAP